MHVRRAILCLVTIFFWAAHDADVASGQSSELMEAYKSLVTLFQQGRYSEAETYAKEALRLGTEEFDPNDPSIATILNKLAELYQVQGRYSEAEPLVQRSLAIREKALGPGHPDVGESLNDLAALYWVTGRYAEAEPLVQRSLAIREKALGPGHPDVAMSVSGLAVLYDARRKGTGWSPVICCSSIPTASPKR